VPPVLAWEFRNINTIKDLESCAQRIGASGLTCRSKDLTQKICHARRLLQLYVEFRKVRIVGANQVLDRVSFDVQGARQSAFLGEWVG